MMYTTPDLQNKMEFESAGVLEAGSIVFFMSDLPHWGADPLKGQGNNRKVLHTYLYDSPPPHGFSCFLLFSLCC
jgi:hypothetical protein